MSAPIQPETLGIAGLETVYDHLAQAIDAVGEAKTALFLVKLALLNAQALGNVSQVHLHIDEARQDL